MWAKNSQEILRINACLSYKSSPWYVMCAQLQRFLAWIHSHFRFIQKKKSGSKRNDMLKFHIFLPNLCNNLIHLQTHMDMPWIEMKWSDFRKSLCCSHFSQTQIHPWKLFVKHVHTSLNWQDENFQIIDKQIDEQWKNMGLSTNHVNKRVAAITFHLVATCEYQSSEIRWFQLDAHETYEYEWCVTCFPDVFCCLIVSILEA